MSDHRRTSEQRLSGRQKVLIGGLFILSPVLLAACDLHHVEATQPCPAASDKGEPAMVKAGLTPTRLDEQQQDCGE